MNELKVSEHWQGNYDEYYEDGKSEWRRLGAVDKADNIETLCRNISVSSVIEIGAGDGAILKRLSDLNFAHEYFALEISKSGVDEIKKREIPQLKECSVFDGYKIPYEDKRFDLAVLSHVVEHVEYPRKILYEASRVAKYIFVEVPLEDTMRLSNDFVLDEVGHINFYSPKTIRRLLQTCDLEILGQNTVNPSKDVYIFQKGKRGKANYYLKEYMLRLIPVLATEIFTYHSALICVATNNVQSIPEGAPRQ